MKILNKRRHFFYTFLIAFFTVLALASCSNEEKNESRDSEHAVPAETSPEPSARVETPTAAPEESLELDEEHAEPDKIETSIDEYSVVLGADATIKIPGIPGELRVWIGSPSFKADFPVRMVQDEEAVPAVGESARVQPFAPAFKIEPEETECIKIHPSGSEVRFKLIPQKQGTFEVGANVFLFDSHDCSGPPIPKMAATLKVLVEVNQKDIFIDKAMALLTVLWEKFVEFWAALLAIFFGLILFLIRGKLKKWFGYEE